MTELVEAEGSIPGPLRFFEILLLLFRLSGLNSRFLWLLLALVWPDPLGVDRLLAEVDRFEPVFKGGTFRLLLATRSRL